MKFAFIAAKEVAFPIATMCRMLTSRAAVTTGYDAMAGLVTPQAQATSSSSKRSQSCRGGPLSVAIVDVHIPRRRCARRHRAALQAHRLPLAVRKMFPSVSYHAPSHCICPFAVVTDPRPIDFRRAVRAVGCAVLAQVLRVGPSRRP